MSQHIYSGEQSDPDIPDGATQDNTTTSFQLSLTEMFYIGLLLLLQMENGLLTVPLISLYEGALWVDFYSEHQQPWNKSEDPCKLPSIQSELALLRRGQGF